MNVGLGSCTYGRDGGRKNKITICEALGKEFWTTFLEDHSASLYYMGKGNLGVMGASTVWDGWNLHKITWLGLAIVLQPKGSLRF